MNGNDGNFDVCCSTATSGQLQQQEYLPRILTYYNYYLFVYKRQERLITNFVYILQKFCLFSAQQNTQAQAAPSNQNQLQPQQANNGNGGNGAE